ncbi:hypothetical protein ACIQF5_21615 [Streptomyces goshikiensis]|uniref:hypothetical protein n=1 Tax=Streptomyces goshikiensis TaxID=1942 RepID=UPI003804E326
MTIHIQRPATVTAHINDTGSSSTSPTESDTVWVLRRWDWHDDDITVYSTQDRALADLAEYVKRSWSTLVQQEDVPALPPSDPREAIRHYYGPDGHSRAEEGYFLHEKKIDIPDSPVTTHAGPDITAQQAPTADVAHTLFEEVCRAAWAKASDDPDDYDLMLRVDAMAPADALEALKKACLPSDLIEWIAAALALLAPDVYGPSCSA